MTYFFTNAPSPVKRVKGMPQISKADDAIGYFEYDIKAKRIKLASGRIYLYHFYHVPIFIISFYEIL